LKKLIKTQTNILPFEIFEENNSYIVEKNGTKVFENKFQYLCLRYAKICIAQERQYKNEKIVESIQILKEQGIL